jgi:hypothetical protein
VNGNGTRLERVKKREDEEKKTVKKRYALDGRQARKKKRIVNLFAEDKKIEVR